MLAIIKKELKNYFVTPSGYVFIGLFLEVSSLIFYLYTFTYGSLNFSYVFYNSAVILTFVIGILTMNTIAGERKNGTYQLIMTSPKSITAIVLGKFIAGVLVIIITELFSCMYLAIIMHFGTPEISTLVPTLLGFLLLTMSYISFGILASSLTENPIIAYVITILFFFASMYLTNVSSIFSYISFMEMFEKFVEGVIPITETVGLLSFTVMCLLLTMISIQRRKNIK
jgi:ABC-2 type transport system permease protein